MTAAAKMGPLSGLVQDPFLVIHTMAKPIPTLIPQASLLPAPPLLGYSALGGFTSGSGSLSTELGLTVAGKGILQVEVGSGYLPQMFGMVLKRNIIGVWACAGFVVRVLLVLFGEMIFLIGLLQGKFLGVVEDLGEGERGILP